MLLNDPPPQNHRVNLCWKLVNAQRALLDFRLSVGRECNTGKRSGCFRSNRGHVKLMFVRSNANIDDRAQEPCHWPARHA